MSRLINLFTCLMFLTSCQFYETSPATISADFLALGANSGTGIETEVGVFGGSGKRIIRPIQSHKLDYTFDGQLLELQYDSASFLKLMPTTIGLPPSWENISSLVLKIATSKPVDLEVELMGSRSRLQYHISLKPGLRLYEIDVREVPLLGGLGSEVLQLSFHFSTAGQLNLHQLELLYSDERTPLVDRWGQRQMVDYPGKISRQEQLATLNTEQAFLDSLNFSFEVDDYGGLSEHNLPLEATGFFHTKQIGEKWYLVSPAGNPFYSLGLNGVRRKSTLNNAALTRIKDRTWLFEKLPAYEDCPECFSPDSAYLSFYCQNVKTKYAGNYERWKEQTRQRFKKLGFNTVGNWSDSLFLGGPIPYTFTLDSRAFTGLRAGHNLPDVFHPDWEYKLDSAFASIAQYAEDPFLVGYFVDNEMSWGSFNDLDEHSFSYQALGAYESLAEKQAVYAERYFSTIHKILKKYDPNHLYLGCRFTRNLKVYRAAAKAAGKYVDVLSVNLYSPFTREEMDAWYQTVNKPILIGEHHIPPITQRALLPRYKAFPLDQRDAMLRQYLQNWLSYPYAVGSHWYQYVDQEVAGRSDGGENQPVGLISVSDQLDRRLGLVFYEFAKTIPENYIE
ncbi:MAG: hypothetical protein AAF705_00915 [Bacteroidota bacterium]